MEIPEKHRELFFRSLGSTENGALLALTFAQTELDVIAIFLGRRKAAEIHGENTLTLSMHSLGSEDDETSYHMPYANIFSGPKAHNDRLTIGEAKIPFRLISPEIYPWVVRTTDLLYLLPNDCEEAQSFMAVYDVHKT